MVEAQTAQKLPKGFPLPAQFEMIQASNTDWEFYIPQDYTEVTNFYNQQMAALNWKPVQCGCRGRWSPRQLRRRRSALGARTIALCVPELSPCEGLVSSARETATELEEVAALQRSFERLDSGWTVRSEATVFELPEGRGVFIPDLVFEHGSGNLPVILRCSAIGTVKRSSTVSNDSTIVSGVYRSGRKPQSCAVSRRVGDRWLPGSHPRVLQQHRGLCRSSNVRTIVRIRALALAAETEQLRRPSRPRPSSEDNRPRMWIGRP